MNREGLIGGGRARDPQRLAARVQHALHSQLRFAAKLRQHAGAAVVLKFDVALDLDIPGGTGDLRGDRNLALQIQARGPREARQSVQRARFHLNAQVRLRAGAGRRYVSLHEKMPQCFSRPVRPLGFAREPQVHRAVRGDRDIHIRVVKIQHGLRLSQLDIHPPGAHLDGRRIGSRRRRQQVGNVPLGFRGIG